MTLSQRLSEIKATEILAATIVPFLGAETQRRNSQLAGGYTHRACPLPSLGTPPAAPEHAWKCIWEHLGSTRPLTLVRVQPASSECAHFLINRQTFNKPKWQRWPAFFCPRYTGRGSVPRVAPSK